MNPLVIYPSAGGAERCDPQKDFVPVALGTGGYPALVVGSGFGAKKLPEAIAKIASALGNSALTCGPGGQATVIAKLNV